MTVVRKSSSKGGLTQEQFVNRRGAACPACQSEEVVDTTPLELENGIAHRGRQCETCKGSWIEQFSLAAFTFFRKDDRAARRRARRLKRKAR